MSYTIHEHFTSAAAIWDMFSAKKITMAERDRALTILRDLLRKYT